MSERTPEPTIAYAGLGNTYGTYPFQLRPGVWVHLKLPHGLTRQDIARISAFLETLVIGEATP